MKKYLLIGLGLLGLSAAAQADDCWREHYRPRYRCHERTRVYYETAPAYYYYDAPVRYRRHCRPERRAYFPLPGFSFRFGG